MSKRESVRFNANKLLILLLSSDLLGIPLPTVPGAVADIILMTFYFSKRYFLNIHHLITLLGRPLIESLHLGGDGGDDVRHLGQGPHLVLLHVQVEDVEKLLKTRLGIL